MAAPGVTMLGFRMLLVATDDIGRSCQWNDHVNATDGHERPWAVVGDHSSAICCPEPPWVVVGHHGSVVVMVAPGSL